MTIQKVIWGSPWNGFENFKFLIASKSTFLSMTKNTLLYYVIFTGIGTTLNVVLAIAIDQCIFNEMFQGNADDYDCTSIYFLCSSSIYRICIY